LLAQASLNHTNLFQIDLATYINLAEAIAACYIGDCGEITNVFTKYLKTSLQLMSDELNNQVLTLWINVLDNAKGGVGVLIHDLEDIKAVIPTLRNEVTTTLDRICQDADVCETEIVGYFFGNGRNYESIFCSNYLTVESSQQDACY
jgi:hypothetical protein